MRALTARALVAEVLGSFLLAMMVAGSGIAAQTLSPGNVGLELFENAAAVAVGLFVLIILFRPLSGAHFNPLVTFVDVGLGRHRFRDGLAYLGAQILGCSAGTVVSNVMFGLATWQISTHHRASLAHLVAEVIATAGLILVVFGLLRNGEESKIAPVVAAYIFTSAFFAGATCFMNPAITIGRMFTNTFTGIAPASVPGFLVAQTLGALIGIGLVLYLLPEKE